MKKIEGLLGVMMCMGIAGAAMENPLPISADYGAVAFRFDDNQTPERWTALASVFSRYRAPFSLSLNPARFSNFSEYRKLLPSLENSGYEIMDHTPLHHAFILPVSDEELGKNVRIHHRDKKQLYLDYRFMKKYSGQPFSADVEGSLISAVPQLNNRSSQLIQVMPNEELYWVCRNPGAKQYELRSFWNEKNVNLAPQTGAEIRLVKTPEGVEPYPENLRFLLRASRRHFESMGIAAPKSWIQPGGVQFSLSAEQLRTCLEEFGYVSAATYPYQGRKYAVSENRELERFRMMWGDFSLEKETAENVISKLADALAKRRLMIASSHLIVKDIPGGMREFLERHDRVLAWCRENHVPILTQRRMAEAFYGGPRKISGNLLPALGRDADGNGQPDGWMLAPGVKCDGKTLKFERNGRIFQIDGLGGASGGNWRLNIQGTLPASATLELRITPKNRICSFNPVLLTWNGTSGEFRQNTSLILPAETQLVDVEASVKSLTGEGNLRNLTISMAE